MYIKRSFKFDWIFIKLISKLSLILIKLLESSEYLYYILFKLGFNTY